MENIITGIGAGAVFIGAAGLVGTNESGVGSYKVAIILMVIGVLTLLIQYAKRGVDEYEENSGIDASYPSFLYRNCKSGR